MHAPRLEYANVDDTCPERPSNKGATEACSAVRCTGPLAETAARQQPRRRPGVPPSAPQCWVVQIVQVAKTHHWFFGSASFIV